MPYVSVSTRKRTLFMFIVCCIIAVLLIVRLVYIQIVKADYYSQRAYTQQTRSKSVEAKRGTIGIPRVLNMYEDYPFWFTFLTSCI